MTSKYKEFFENDLKINEDVIKFTKPPKISSYSHVKNEIPPIEDYNFMADILFLPTTKKGFKYLLMVVDLINNDFDIEPMKNKISSDVLKSMLKMFKRNYIKKPYASIRTDGGTEFKGVFHKYLYDESIYHSVALPYRHKQLSNVNNLSKILGRTFSLYMNKKEEETKKKYNEWTDIVDEVRKKLNEIRHVEIDKDKPYNFDDDKILYIEQNFN